MTSKEWLFHPLFPGWIGIWERWCLLREENRSTRRKPSEQGREQTTHSTHIWRQHRESNPGHISGRRVLSSLRHPCTPKFEYASRPTKKLVNLDHLCSTSFSVWCKMLTIFAVHYIITGHPLIRILTALRANLRDTCTSSKVELNPRISDATPRAPRPSVPSHAPLMQPSVSRCAVIVVEGWSGDELIRKTAVFDAKWNVATTWSKAKQLSLVLELIDTKDFAWLQLLH